MNNSQTSPLRTATRWLALATVAFVFGSSAQAIEKSADAARVTSLADRYVAEFKVNFPLQYEFSGLTAERHDGIRHQLSGCDRQMAGF